MILSKKISIKKPNGKNFSYYKSLGYDVYKDNIEVKIEHLSLGSKYEIDVKCFYCGNKKKLSYNSYNKSTNNGNQNYACYECGHIKQREICIKKNGVENISQLEKTKAKIKKTNLERYGVDHYNKTNDFKEKVKKTCLKKYGVDNYSKTGEYKEKVKETSLKKWGVNNYSKTDEYKEKVKETCLKKYGVVHYNKTDEFKEKVKETNLLNLNVEWPTQSELVINKIRLKILDKYGVDHYSKTEEYKEKFKKTNLERYGVDHYSKTEEYKEKFKKTNLERYGVEYYSKTDEYKEKVIKASLKKWGVDNYTKTEEYKKRSKKTCLKKWGVESYAKTDEYKKKSKKTNLEKYGVTCISKNKEFRKKFNITNDKNYIKYLDIGKSLFKCDLGLSHNFIIKADNYFSRKKLSLPLCTICNPIGDSRSIKEKELFEYINSIYDGKIIQSYRDGLEIDIYLPELKIGFEFNGIYYHSSKFKEKNYHLNKTNLFKEKGIRIIHIWEDDWTNKKAILESQIKNWLGLTEIKIFARKCEVKEIKEYNEVKNFLDENHIQGSYKNIKKTIGLFYENKMISIMTFDKFEGRKKMNDYGWNLSRFCSLLNTSVVGSSSKLLSYFINNNKVNRIISYADKSWSKGNIYEKLKFIKVYETNCDYKYIINGVRKHKSNFRRSHNDIKTESKKMKDMNINRIYDCGKIKYELVI